MSVQKTRDILLPVISVTLCLFVLAEVNFPRLQTQSALAVFVMLGLTLCYLKFPASEKWKDNKTARAIDLGLAGLTVIVCGYVIVQSEPLFRWSWFYGKSLGDRAGIETTTDFVVGVVGLLLVLEATRRSIGWIVPILAVSFMSHSLLCYCAHQGILPPLPAFILPHAGQNLEYVVSTTWSQSLGVFGPAAGVMFKYVFLFIVFGAFLQMSGATQFIIDFAQRVFGSSPGGPAKVSVLGSGLMGSLSGSAVANAVTTGTFTIPMMRNAGFERHIAGGITAAAAAGGALVPPVMGAGAYMMLELVQPQVKFWQIAKAALIPSILYYLSLLLIVHFYSRRIGKTAKATEENGTISKFQGLVFFAALGALVLLLVMGFTAFKAVTFSLVVILVLAMLNPNSELDLKGRKFAIGIFSAVTLAVSVYFAAANPPAMPTFRLWAGLFINASVVGMFGLLLFALSYRRLRSVVLETLEKAAKDGVSLVAAAACVGIIIGVVQSTGIATDFSAVIKGVVSHSLFLALVGIMICSIVLGMGVPSVVCYLLMATLMGSLLEQMGVQPLAAHLFIFYFGMMSMVTPPVALAAYASASIAKAKIMPTALASFRFALVGFMLPFMFVYRPALLLLAPLEKGANLGLDLTDPSSLLQLAIALSSAVVGIIALAASLAGYLLAPLSTAHRVVLFAAAALSLPVGSFNVGLILNLAAAVILFAMVAINRRSKPSEAVEAVESDAADDPPLPDSDGAET